MKTQSCEERLFDNAKDPRKDQGTDVRSRLSSFLCENIDTGSHLLEAQLFTLALAIGIQDAVSIQDFDCFASNQTGNTVLLAVSLLQRQSTAVEQSMIVAAAGTLLVSLGLFVLGVLVAGQLANAMRAIHRRWWLLSSSLLQSLLVFAVAGMQLAFPTSRTDRTALGRVALGLLAFSSGMQVAMVRAMKISDITTAMATAAFVDVFIDPKLMTALQANRGRNRRVGFLTCLVAGSFIGAVMARSAGGPFAVILSAILKTLVAASFMCNVAEPGAQDDSLQVV